MIEAPVDAEEPTPEAQPTPEALEPTPEAEPAPAPKRGPGRPRKAKPDKPKKAPETSSQTETSSENKSETTTSPTTFAARACSGTTGRPAEPFELARTDRRAFSAQTGERSTSTARDVSVLAIVLSYTNEAQNTPS